MIRTVGEILKNYRESKKITLEEVAIETRIKKEYLLAIESNNFKKFPYGVSTRGFIKNYAEYLGLSSKDILAIFRRDSPQKIEDKIIPQGMIKAINEKNISWNPKTTVILTVVIIFLGIISYLGYQYFSFVGNPKLEVISPKDGEKTTQKKVEIFGKADQDSSVTINDNLALISEGGEFHYELDLFPGENRIIVEAKSKLGRKTIIERTVFRLDN